MTGPAEPRLSALFVAAVLVAALVTPALGATEAGRLAPDHSEHGSIVPGHQLTRRDRARAARLREHSTLGRQRRGQEMAAIRQEASDSAPGSSTIRPAS